MTIERDRARGVVLRHARDAAEAAELLAMLGLDDDQVDLQDTTRVHGGLVGRRSAGVHALSAATEARLAAPIEPPAAAMPTAVAAVAPPAQIPAPRPSSPPAPAHGGSRSDESRSCAGCGNPVVRQTRYRLDPAGYRARGVRLLAAKGRCHPCYNRLRRPADANFAKDGPASEVAPAEPAAVVEHQVDVDEPRVEIDELKKRLAAQKRYLEEAFRGRDRAVEERDRLVGLLEEAGARIVEMQCQVEHVLAMAEQLAAETSEPERHEHTYQWSNPKRRPSPCECGRPWPGTWPPGGAG